MQATIQMRGRRRLPLAAVLGSLLASLVLALSLAASSVLADATVEMIEGSASDINSWAFTPAEVTISAGQTVTWRNAGQQGHTATASNGQFDTGNVAPGESTSVTLSAPGTFAYVCTPHPWMKGTLIVQAAAAPPPAQPAAPPPAQPAAPTPAPAPPAAAAAPPAAPAAGQAVPTPTPFRFLTPTPATRPSTAGATTTAPRAGGFPVELAAPILAGGASAIGGGLYLLRRRRRSD